MPVHNVHPQATPPVHAADVLAAHGLLLAVEISIPEALAAALTRQGKTLPPVAGGAALVDTGASCCAVEESLLAQLGLQPVRPVNVSSPNGSRLQNLYFAKLIFPGSPIPPLELEVIGVQMGQGRMLALIGRDFLRQCLLVYNGPAGNCSLAF